MKFKFLHIFSFVLFALAFNACKHDDFNTMPLIPDGMNAIELHVKVMNQATSSPLRSTSTGTTLRALGTEPGNNYIDNLNENKIDNVEVFLFNTDGTLKKRANSTSGLQQTGDDTQTTLRILIPIANVPDYENKNFKIVAVANASVTIPASVATLDELKAILQETTNINKPDTPQPKFLMDGEINSQTIRWGEKVTYVVPGELPLRRAAAKIRLRIKNVNVNVKENGVTVHYDMEGQPEVRLVHYTEKTSLLQGSPFTIASTDWKNAAYRAMNPYTFTGLVNDTDPANPTNSFLAASVPFYAYENDWSANINADETYLMVKIGLKAKDASGNYGAVKDYYYRIPINYRMKMPGMTVDEISGLHKMQRNYLYDIVSSIGVLGSEDEGNPFELDAFVAVQPWNEVDIIDGSIASAHYLVVKELHPLMPNIDTREVGYLSDLPITIKIDKTVFEYYDSQGDLYRFTDNGTNVKVTVNDQYWHTFQYGENFGERVFTRFDGANVISNVTDPLSKKLIITHQIPNNYVPFDMYFTVTHVMPSGETGTPLSQAVHVTQYPPKYVTGTKSYGFRPNSGDTGPYADFRHHSPFGAIASNPVTGQNGTQKNDVFFRITTVVNTPGESIGDPTNSDGSTRNDAASNKLISPEFIIATQNGMSSAVYQYSGGSTGTSRSNYGSGYGPYSEHYTDVGPYYSGYQSGGLQDTYKSYTNAADRCANYFEGEYGTNGNYTEHFVEEYISGYDNYYNPIYAKRWNSRTVAKTFKYQGHWRIPTVAEIEYINGIQDAPGSAVKHLLWGAYYWSAETGTAFNFNNNNKVIGLTNSNLDGGVLGVYYDSSGNFHGERPYVRCIFDTYKVND